MDKEEIKNKVGLTEKEVKEWLNRAYEIDEEIARDKKEKKRLEDIIDSLPGVSYDKTNVQTSKPRNASFEKRIEKLEEIKERVENRIVEKEEIKEEINNTVNLLEDHYERKVIILRHYHFLEWYDIKKEMSYSRPHCFRIYNQAIKNILIILRNKDETK